jgi:phosphoribosylformylglycinamidine synthase
VIEDAARAVGIALTPGLDLVVIGETRGWLGQSLWLREIAGREEGAPPPVDLAAERRNGDFVRAQILAAPGGARVRACHDAADGGLLLALAEMALAGDVGATLDPPPAGLPAHAFWFGEDQGRYVLAVEDGPALLAAAAAAGVPAARIGRTGTPDSAPPHGHPGQGWALVLPGGRSISLPGLREAHERFLPALMEER